MKTIINQKENANIEVLYDKVIKSSLVAAQSEIDIETFDGFDDEVSCNYRTLYVNPETSEAFLVKRRNSGDFFTFDLVSKIRRKIKNFSILKFFPVISILESDVRECKSNINQLISDKITNALLGGNSKDSYLKNFENIILDHINRGIGKFEYKYTNQVSVLNFLLEFQSKKKTETDKADETFLEIIQEEYISEITNRASSGSVLSLSTFLFVFQNKDKDQLIKILTDLLKDKSISVYKNFAFVAVSELLDFISSKKEITSDSLSTRELFALKKMKEFKMIPFVDFDISPGKNKHQQNYHFINSEIDSTSNNDPLTKFVESTTPLSMSMIAGASLGFRSKGKAFTSALSTKSSILREYFEYRNSLDKKISVTFSAFSNQTACESVRKLYDLELIDLKISPLFGDCDSPNAPLATPDLTIQGIESFSEYSEVGFDDEHLQGYLQFLKTSLIYCDDIYSRKNVKYIINTNVEDALEKAEEEFNREKSQLEDEIDDLKSEIDDLNQSIYDLESQL